MEKKFYPDFCISRDTPDWKTKRKRNKKKKEKEKEKQ